MLADKLSAYFRSVAATRRPHLRGMPFLPKRWLKLVPFNREAYNGFLTEAVCWDLGPNPRIFDVGANNGDFAMAFQQAYPGAALHLFEPLERHLARLDAMKEMGGFEWTIHRCALGRRSEELEIEVPEGQEAASSLHGFGGDYLRHNPGAGRTSRQICQVRPLDELTEGDAGAIDLLKIDVEGFEFAVLDGAAGTLPRVRNAVVEVSLLRHSDEPDCPIARMVERMNRAGLQLFRMQPTLFDSVKSQRAVEFDLYFSRHRREPK